MELHERIEKLETHLEGIDAKVEGYEAMARGAKGKPSPSFLNRVTELKQHRGALGTRLTYRCDVRSCVKRRAAYTADFVRVMGGFAGRGPLSVVCHGVAKGCAPNTDAAGCLK